MLEGNSMFCDPKTDYNSPEAKLLSQGLNDQNKTDFIS